MKLFRSFRLLWPVLLLLACTLPLIAAPPEADPAVTSPVAPTGTPVLEPATPTPAATSEATATAPPLPDLDMVPLYWFAPLPPMPTGPGRMFTGSDDFMDLFEPGAPWDEAAGSLQVFKLYGEWVAYHATDGQLRQAVEAIRARGLALAVEAGPLNATAECGQGIEGFAGTDEGALIAERILAAGGTLDLIAMDEPFYYGHFYEGPNACNWSAEEIAAGVDAFIRHMRTFFPDVRVGDTEPTPHPVLAGDYSGWLSTFRETAGYDLDFLHLDIDWSRTDWPLMTNEIDAFGEEFGVPVGIIYTGNFGDQDDEAWLSIAGERVKAYELEHGGTPGHVLFQSWNDKPDRALPDSDPYSFTGFIAEYFLEKAGLGFSGDDGNLAFGASVRVSNFLPGSEGGYAVDRDPGTTWSSGTGPVQWIEIDLGVPTDISLIRLIPSQFPEGPTVHNVYGRGQDGELVLLVTLEGNTADSASLEYEPPGGWPGIQVLRIETVESPSWVAWREIEVYGMP